MARKSLNDGELKRKLDLPRRKQRRLPGRSKRKPKLPRNSRRKSGPKRVRNLMR
jgi:hypothetical protein